MKVYQFDNHFLKFKCYNDFFKIIEHCTLKVIYIKIVDHFVWKRVSPLFMSISNLTFLDNVNMKRHCNMSLCMSMNVGRGKEWGSYN
jgi:hypothetical protein